VTTTLTAADRAAIARTADDYIGSWLDGDAERMRRCLHPDLAKRSLNERRDAIDHITAAEMVEATGEGRGKKYARGHTVEILAVDDDIATAKLTSVPYVDYLHLARFGAEWRIVNVLWRRRLDAPPR
jgi:hypothetical protein